MMQLPDPIETISRSGVVISCFLAKQAQRESWMSEELRTVVVRARRSYSRYGYVPPLDDYDRLAVVFAVRTIYKDENGESVTEWFSVRFLPGHLLGVSEMHRFLQVYVDDQTLAQMIKNRITETEERYWFISRICGSIEREAGSLGPHITPQYTSEALCLAFSCLLSRFSCGQSFLLGIFRDELVERSLQRIINKERLPRFSGIESILGGTQKHRVCIDRSIEAYRYPGYFFDTADLKEFLCAVGRQSLIPPVILRRYLGVHADSLLQGGQVPVSAFSRLGLLFVHPERKLIPKTELTGGELRRRLDAAVADGPHPRVLDAEALRNELVILRSEWNTCPCSQ
jgi:hypothetical protein